ncbi:MAG TPA: polysaccharide deacetylase family protein [Caulifigura sp.]|nr:polysaccharide deacetylase family protein [Caulifigura sp.]
MSPFVCLMYHNVCRADQLGADGPFAQLGPSIQSYAVTTEQFSEQTSAIGRDRLLDPDALRKPVSAKPSRPQVLVTFDDGWAGTFEEAGPILEAAGARAIVFVTSGLIGHPLFASEALLRELPRDVFEIGSHTVTHPFLAEGTTKQIEKELRDSRAELEDIVGRTVDTISIPNGSFDQRVLRIAEECGYSLVFTSEPHLNQSPPDHRGIGRVAVRSTTTTDAILRWCDGDLGAAGWRRKALDVPKQLLGPERYRRLRAWALGEKRNDDDMSDLVVSHQSASRELVLSNGV